MTTSTWTMPEIDAVAEQIADIKRDCSSFRMGCLRGSPEAKSWAYVEDRLGQLLIKLDPAVAEASLAAVVS